MKIQATFEKLPTMAGPVNMPATRCPFGNNAMVGSSICQLCKNFISYDADTKEIECNHNK